MFNSPGLAELDPAQCLRLLGSVGIGRVVFTMQAMPAIQPVRYVLHEHAVYFRVSAAGAVAVGGDGVVAFEADELDPELLTGWCVTVIGRASELGADQLPDGLAAAVPDGWAPLDNDRFIRIQLEVINGRRLGAVPQPR